VFIMDAEGFLTRRSEETGSLHPAWVTTEDDPVEIEVATVPVVGPPVGESPDPVLWAVDPAGSLMRIDAESGDRVAVQPVGASTLAVAIGADGIVYVATDAPELVAYDPIQRNERFRIALEVAPAAPPVEWRGIVFVAGVDGAVRAYGEVGQAVLGGEPSEPTLAEGFITDVSWSSNGALAFVRGQDVWIVPAGQNEAVNVTGSHGGGSAPAWSPKGTVLAYVSGAAGSGDVVLLRPDGTDRRNLTATESKDERDPAWSPDGSRIIFSSRTCAGQGGSQPERVCSPLAELGIADPITGRTRAVIGTAAVFSSVRDPSWSPVGDLIAFVGDRSGGAEPGTSGWHLWTMTPAGSDLTALPDPDGVGGRAPTFSPDGSKLGYRSGSDPAEAAALYVLDLATGVTTRIPDLPIGTGDPAWSPDGLRLAFAADMWTPGRIYTVSVDP
jgi:dipeptidyl aminopeptidase/acylaminoacyl peptidase